MKTNRILYLLLTTAMVLGMILSACAPAPAAEAPAVEEPEAPAEPAPEPEPAEEALTLDDTFGTMLASMEGYNTIKADALLLEMAEDTPPFLLDVRTAAELEEQGHIEGATHIPLNELAQHIDLLPAFDTSIVAYCGTGWRATIAMTALHGMGWTNVRALKTTFADWVAAGNPVAEGIPEAMALNVAEPDATLVEAADAYLVGIKDHGVKFGIETAENLNIALVENPELFVLDVRRAEEVEEKGYIDAPNYVHIPLESFVADMAMWPAADAPITVYCGSGHRSTMAMTILFAYGYDDVTSLSGGYGGWANAGYATVGGVPTLAQNYVTMLDNMTSYNTTKADALLLEMVEDTPPFLLDVRSTAELEENGHIEGATHIPLNELAQHIDLLPSFDTPIVAYCGSGWRATIAMTALHGMGWTDVRALKTTFSDWVAAGNPVVEGLPEPMVLDVASVPESLTAPIDTAVVWAKDHGWGVKSAEDLNLALVDNPDLILIDVRTTGEVEEKGVIAVVDQELLTIPLEGFIADMAMWPADKDAEIVVYCGSGHRSTMAMEILLSNGYTNVTSLKGGFGGWAEAGLPVAEYAAAE
jgi:rhodanese-related sulfurtransferase